MARPAKLHNVLIIEYQLRLTTFQLDVFLNLLTKDNNSLSKNITIHDKRNTKSMDISFNATLTSDTDITFTIFWTDNNTQHSQSFNIFKHIYPMNNTTQIKYYFVIDGKHYRNIYYNEQQFKTDKQFPSRTEDSFISGKKRNLRIIANPKKYYAERSTPACRIRAYMRYQAIYNDFLMEMYKLATGNNKKQLDKFIEWSETLKESIKNMKQ